MSGHFISLLACVCVGVGGHFISYLDHAPRNCKSARLIFAFSLVPGLDHGCACMCVWASLSHTNFPFPLRVAGKGAGRVLHQQAHAEEYRPPPVPRQEHGQADRSGPESQPVCGSFFSFLLQCLFSLSLLASLLPFLWRCFSLHPCPTSFSCLRFLLASPHPQHTHINVQRIPPPTPVAASQ